MIGDAARRIARAPPPAGRQQRGAHASQIGADRIGERAAAGAAAEQLAPGLPAMKEQVTASFKPRAASAAGVAATRRCAGVERRARHAVARGSGTGGILSKPWMRSDLLDQIGLAFDIGAPGRQRHAAIRRRRLDARSRARRRMRRCSARAARRCRRAAATRSGRSAMLRGAQSARRRRSTDLARLAAAQLEDQSRRRFHARHRAEAGSTPRSKR